MFKESEISVEVGGKKLTFKTGKVARQAGGSVLLEQGETTVFASACASPHPSHDIDFLPLRVDYQEKFSSAGKTLGGFIKREGRPTERETLMARLIDRPIRPMFVDGYFHETQVLTYVYSYDGQHRPDVMALCAASAALVISEIPLTKPLAGVRVGMVNGEFVINPTTSQMEESTLDLLLAGTEDAILMIEGYCDFLTEEQVLNAIETGQVAIAKICHALAEWREQIGKPKMSGTMRVLPAELLDKVRELTGAKLKSAFEITKKEERSAMTSDIKSDLMQELCPAGCDHIWEAPSVGLAFKRVSSELMREAILSEGRRPDGRGLTDVRPIAIEQAFLPRTHGSSLFTRGETQALAVCTLGGETMGQRYEDLHGQGQRHFYLQYFFPPFSVGEVGRMGPAGRREVGHGKLAERAIQAALPSREEFPYVIRLESNITESNGSSSMASVCGGCLALMDAGVPLKRPVSGIAMGLILDGDRYAILSDILGVEDALGDMDFKITGDEHGITAFQMDIKVEGITHEIMAAALAQAKAGLVHILGKMKEACPAPRAELAEHAPRIETIKIPVSKIGAVIGPGGSQIRAITEECGVEINIDDDGSVSLASPNAEGLKKARAIIEGLTAEVVVGKIYDGKVVAVKPFGAFVEVLPGREGLCHISELSDERVNDIEAFIKPGDPCPVKVMEINERGQLKLSRRVALAERGVPQEAAS